MKEAKKDTKAGKGSSVIWKILFSKIPMSLVLVLALMILSSMITINVARKSPELFELVKGPAILQREEDELVARVGSLIALPEDEDPVVATVSDKEKLEGQVFFENAIEGDKVLIYTEASKVVLYRPSERRVVEVGTVNIQDTAGLEQEQGQVEVEEVELPEPTPEAEDEVDEESEE